MKLLCSAIYSGIYISSNRVLVKQAKLFQMPKERRISHEKQKRLLKMGTKSNKKMESASGESNEKFTFFFTTATPFSQFHPAEFTVDGIKYNCAEQYMMHQKAVLFKDDKMAAQILKETDPKSIKACGRKVQNFDDATWLDKCREIVREGNMAKFTQNASLQTKLLATAGTTLVEASPRDCRWGIGLGANNPKAQDRKQWRGKNWLGFALTEVRDEIMRAKGDLGATSDN